MLRIHNSGDTFRPGVVVAALMTAFIAMASGAASKDMKVTRGISSATQKSMVAAANARSERRSIEQLATVRAATGRVQRVLEPLRQDLLGRLRAERRGPAFLRDMEATNKQLAAAKTIPQLRSAISSYAQVRDRHDALLQDLRPGSGTEALRDEFARSLGVRPSDLDREGDSLTYKDTSLSIAASPEIARSPRKPPPESSFSLIMEAPYSLQASYREPDEQSPWLKYFAWTIADAFVEFPGQAQSWSVARVDIPGGLSSTRGWAYVGESFTVPSGFSRLRVAGRIDLSNDLIHVLPMSTAGGSIRETIELYVAGPNQLFEVGVVTLTAYSVLGGSSLSDDPYPLSQGVDVPIALEFDIPEAGGEFSVWYLVTSSASAYAGGGAIVVDSGMVSVHVRAFEVEAIP